jgi:transcriptional regulator with XRE-family HTH domain
MQQESTYTVHQGRNIKRFREMLGLKQDALAAELGEDWTQRRVSLLEAKEEVEDDILEQVAKVLKVPADAIRNFTEEAAFNIIGNTVHNHDNGALVNYYPTFNPIDKVVELYERLVESEREKVALLESLLKQKS